MQLLSFREMRKADKIIQEMSINTSLTNIVSDYLGDNSPAYLKIQANKKMYNTLINIKPSTHWHKDVLQYINNNISNEWDKKAQEQVKYLINKYW